MSIFLPTFGKSIEHKASGIRRFAPHARNNLAHVGLIMCQGEKRTLFGVHPIYYLTQRDVEMVDPCLASLTSYGITTCSKDTHTLFT